MCFLFTRLGKNKTALSLCPSLFICKFLSTIYLSSNEVRKKIRISDEIGEIGKPYITPTGEIGKLDIRATVPSDGTFE